MDLRVKRRSGDGQVGPAPRTNRGLLQIEVPPPNKASADCVAPRVYGDLSATFAEPPEITDPIVCRTGTDSVMVAFGQGIDNGGFRFRGIIRPDGKIAGWWHREWFSDFCAGTAILSPHP